jgi:hypothetical protein
MVLLRLRPADKIKRAVRVALTPRRLFHHATLQEKVTQWLAAILHVGTLPVMFPLAGCSTAFAELSAGGFHVA